MPFVINRIDYGPYTGKISKIFQLEQLLQPFRLDYAK